MGIGFLSDRVIDPQTLTSTSALFENYDEDLNQLLSSLKGKLEGDVKQLKGGESTSSAAELPTCLSLGP